MSSRDGPAARNNGIRVGSMKEMSERRAEERLEERCDKTDEGIIVEEGVDSRRSAGQDCQYWHGRLEWATHLVVAASRARQI